MFETLFTTLKHQSKKVHESTKRRFLRRDADKCISVINDKTYPVENWSMGGLLIHGDSRPFGIDNEIDVMMKFKLRDDIIDVPHRARVVRKSRDKVAFEFLPLNGQIRRSFQNVIDDHVVAQFVDSQLA